MVRMANTLGQKIRATREAKNIDQESLGLALGRSRETISRYESQNREIPTSDLKKIAHHLEIDALELLEARLRDRISETIRLFKESK